MDHRRSQTIQQGGHRQEARLDRRQLDGQGLPVELLDHLPASVTLWGQVSADRGSAGHQQRDGVFRGQRGHPNLTHTRYCHRPPCRKQDTERRHRAQPAHDHLIDCFRQRIETIEDEQGRRAGRQTLADGIGGRLRRQAQGPDNRRAGALDVFTHLQGDQPDPTGKA